MAVLLTSDENERILTLFPYNLRTLVVTLVDVGRQSYLTCSCDQRCTRVAREGGIWRLRSMLFELLTMETALFRNNVQKAALGNARSLITILQTYASNPLPLIS